MNIDKRIKFVVVSNKGGVGKTAVAVQILTPFLYEYFEMEKHGQRVDFVNLDAVNNTKETVFKSEILNFIDVKMDRDAVIKQIMKPSPCVIDVGGNKASDEIIHMIAKEKMTQQVYWVIPVGDGKEDAVNAGITLENIKKHEDNPKIIWALTQTISKDPESFKKQFIYVFGHNYIDLAISERLQYFDENKFFTMTITENYNLSRSYKKTIYEMSSEQSIEKADEEFQEMYEKYNQEFEEKGDYSPESENLMMATSFFRGFSSDLQEYHHETIKPAFLDIEKIVTDYQEQKKSRKIQTKKSEE